MSGTTEAKERAQQRLDAWWQRWFARLPAPYRGLVQRLVDRDVLLAASSLAFYGVISSLPLMVISLAVARGVLGDTTIGQLAQTASSTGAQGMGRLASDLVEAARSFHWAVVVVFLWPATAYGGGLRRALREIQGADEPLPGLKGRAIGLLLVLVLPAIVLAGIPLSFTLTRLGGDGALQSVLGLLLALGGGTLAGTVVVTILYQAFTTTRSLPWRTTVPIAAVVAALSSLLSLGFLAYLRVADLEQRYGNGVLALLLLFGVWMLATNVLLLAGYHGIAELDER